MLVKKCVCAHHWYYAEYDDLDDLPKHILKELLPISLVRVLAPWIAALLTLTIILRDIETTTKK
ncbi:MAG: hypothetical protein ABSE39_13630 [Candidatus Bathyarchaeia archaeon]